jgi:hypothetical protein
MAVKWADPKKMAKAAEHKYQTLNYMLGQYGVNNITGEQFWGQMKQNGWGQTDIDAWCVEYYQREQEKEDAEQAKREEGRYGSARATASRDARGPRREEQGADRQAEQGREGRGQGREEDGEAQRSWKVTDEWAYLTRDEVNACARFGLSLQERAEKRNFKKTPGETADNATLGKQHALSQVTEGAMRRHFGWPLEFNANGFNEPDLPGRLQVRSITGEHKGLKVKSRDGADWRVVGVIAPPGKERGPYRLPGWYLAGDAQQREDWAKPWFDGPPVYIVPQKLLRPMSELREILRSEGLIIADYQPRGSKVGE